MDQDNTRNDINLEATRENTPIRPPRRRRSARYETEENGGERLPEKLISQPEPPRPEAPRQEAGSRISSGAPAARGGSSMMARAQRPIQSAQRPVQSPQRPMQSLQRPAQSPQRPMQSPQRPAGSGQAGSPIRVGYAAGRMGDPAKLHDAARMGAGEADGTRRTDLRGIQSEVSARNMPARKWGEPLNGLPGREEEPPRKKGKLWLRLPAALLIVIGLALVAVQLLPEDNGIRMAAADLAGRAVALLPQSSPKPKATEMPMAAQGTVTDFQTINDKGTTPPTVTVTTSGTVTDVRLVTGRDRVIDAEFDDTVSDENTVWVATIVSAKPLKAEARLQVKQGGEWKETGLVTSFAYTPPAESTVEATTGGIGELLETPTPAETETPTNTPEPTEEPTPKPTETPEPTEEPTEAPTEEPTPTPEPTEVPRLTAEAADSADPALLSTQIVYDGSKKVKDYVRPAKSVIRMPLGGDYVRNAHMGVLTFRMDAFRQNAAAGWIDSAGGLSKIWEADAASAQGVNQTYYGITRVGQPAIVRWSKEVREKSQLEEGKREKKNLTEVIIAGEDGNIYFLDLDDGTRTRDSIKLRYPMKGSPSVHPGGAPYMTVGQFARKMKVKTGKIGLRTYNLYKKAEMTLIDGLDGKMHRAFNDIGSFETSALIDRTSDTLITAGTNGLLYLVSLNSTFDYEMGVYTQDLDTVVLKSKAKGTRKDSQTAVEASVAMYDRYVYYADMSGVLRCVDTDSLKAVWAVETGDAVESTPALELQDGDRLNLYTANLLMNRTRGNAMIRRYNALSGAEIWCREIPVEKNKKTKAAVGVFASPVVGQHDLEGIIWYTVTGLSEEGRSELGLNSETMTSALIAMDRETGKTKWVYGMEGSCVSSPVAVYTEDGKGWIIQCGSDGSIVMMDGLTGREQARLKVDGEITASPAVYGNKLVIGTTGKGTSHIYGILIE